MPTTKVLYGHELADLVGEEQLFEAADLNNISITEALTPGITLTVPARPTARKAIDERLAPASAPKPVRVWPGQMWIDLVLQQLGDEERLFELCDLNDAGITDDLAPGVVIRTPAAEANKQRIVNLLTQTKPASIFYGVGDPQPEGIEFWAIEFDFVVS